MTYTFNNPAAAVCYGSAWLTPTQVLGGRLFKLGGQVDFQAHCPTAVSAPGRVDVERRLRHGDRAR